MLFPCFRSTQTCFLLFTCSTFQACNNMFWFEYDMQRTDRTYKSLQQQEQSPKKHLLENMQRTPCCKYQMIQVTFVVPQSPTVASVRMSSCNGKASHSSHECQCFYPELVLFHLHQRKDDEEEEEGWGKHGCRTLLVWRGGGAAHRSSPGKQKERNTVVTLQSIIKSILSSPPGRKKLLYIVWL